MSLDTLPAESPDGLPRSYSPADVAAALGVSEWWVREQARLRRIEHLRVNQGAVRFTRDQAHALVALATVRADREPPKPQGLLSARSRARSRNKAS